MNRSSTSGSILAATSAGYAARIARPLAEQCSGKVVPCRDAVDHPDMRAVQHRAVHGLADLVEDAAHVRLDGGPQVGLAGGGEPGELGPDADPSGRGGGGDQAVGRQRGNDPVDGGPGKPDLVRELGQAESLVLAVQRAQHLANTRDDLDSARYLGYCHAVQRI